MSSIHIQGQNSGSVDYSDLPTGTYYLRETDAQGNPRPLDDSFVDDNTLTVNVTRLRRKLSDAGLSDFIRTKKGIGYMVGA